jgi:tRNA G10  N-methylase Trm11
MFQYAFVLGHEPDLSYSEIQSAARAFFGFEHADLTQHKQIAILKTEAEINAPAWMQRLGGTQKILKAIAITHDTSPLIAITKHLQEVQPEGKLVFSLSGDDAKTRAKDIKKRLKDIGRSVRYVEPKNAATVEHNHLVGKQGDITISHGCVWVTVALQPFEAFADRDYGRPMADSKRGMLPPKLARMMINLAGIPNEATIYDPFCGLATVLAEGYSLGYSSLIGTDIDPKAISQAKENMQWLIQKEGRIVSPELFTHDATVTSTLPRSSVDAIVTEPFLGKPIRGQEDIIYIRSSARALSALYTSSFRAFSSALKTDGVILFIFPSFICDGEVVTTISMRDIENQGYKHVPFSPTLPFLRYHRESQYIARDIYQFKKI